MRSFTPLGNLFTIPTDESPSYEGIGEGPEAGTEGGLCWIWVLGKKTDGRMVRELRKKGQAPPKTAEPVPLCLTYTALTTFFRALNNFS